MALSGAQLQAMLDDLDRALYSGAQSVTFTGAGISRTIAYESRAAMLQARADLVLAISGAAAPASFALATHSRD